MGSGVLKKQKKSSGPLVRRIGAERNYVDVSQATYGCDTTGSITLLNTVAQGASVSQRIGKKWLMKSIQCRGMLYCSSTGTHRGAGVAIVYDKRPTGSLPAITDIFVSTDDNSFSNDVNSGRFRIIRRWDFQLNGNTTNPLDTTTAQFEHFIPLNKIVVNKAAGTGVISDIEEGALYLVTLGNVTAGTASATLSAQFRIRFVDL